MSRARFAVTVGLGLVLVIGLYVYYVRPDPVVETRIVRGVVTYWTREQTDMGSGDLIVRASLDDGRVLTIKQLPVDIPQYGPAEIEERRHASGRLSFRWVKNQSQAGKP